MRSVTRSEGLSAGNPKDRALWGSAAVWYTSAALQSGPARDKKQFICASHVMDFLTRTSRWHLSSVSNSPRVDTLILSRKYNANPAIVIKITQRRKKINFLTCPGLCHIFSLFGGCVAGICCHSPSGEDHTHHQLMGMKKKSWACHYCNTHPWFAPSPHPPLRLPIAGVPSSSLPPPRAVRSFGDFLPGKIQHRNFHYWPMCGA